MFQFTRPQGARRAYTIVFANCQRFNSRARKGRDAASSRPFGHAFVSIHAPARGATLFRRLLPTIAVVSIHAPARGATAFQDLLDLAAEFQFTRPQGARPLAKKVSNISFKFQFTRPQGARQKWVKTIVCCKCFNSRARKGRDGRYYSIFTCCLNWAFFANRDTARHPCALAEGPFAHSSSLSTDNPNTRRQRYRCIFAQTTIYSIINEQSPRTPRPPGNPFREPPAERPWA